MGGSQLISAKMLDARTCFVPSHRRCCAAPADAWGWQQDEDQLRPRPAQKWHARASPARPARRRRDQDHTITTGKNGGQCRRRRPPAHSDPERKLKMLAQIRCSVKRAQPGALVCGALRNYVRLCVRLRAGRRQGHKVLLSTLLTIQYRQAVTGH